MEIKKPGKLISIAIASILILTASCNKDENNLPTTEEKNIQFLKSELGGCNDTWKSGEAEEESADTVLINLNLSSDTMNIFVGINYICCAPFVTDCNLVNDSIFITISDNCTISDIDGCYCRCSCYYTFDYYFENIDSKNYYWQIILDDPRKETPILFNSGSIDLTKTIN